MHQNKPARDATRRLEEAVNRVGKDAQKTQILAAALCGFAKPVPEYELLRRHLLRPCESGGEDVGRTRPFWRDFFRDR
jgi:ferritin-like metal-binding protein YciE